MSQSLKLFLKNRSLINSRFLNGRNFCSHNKGNGEKVENETNKSKEDKNKFTEIQNKKFTEDKKEAAKKKLMSLLSEFQVDSSVPKNTNLNLAKAVKRISKKERFKDKLKTPEDELKTAAKQVADTLSSEPEKMQYEINQKLTSLNLIKTSSENSDDIDISEQMKEEDFNERSKTILAEDVNQNIMSSVKDVASAVQGEASPIRSKLTEKLFRLSVEGKVPTESKKSIQNLVMEMTVDKDKKQVPVKETRGHFVPSDKGRMTQRQLPGVLPHIDIYGSPPLDIFTDKPKSGSNLSLWKKLDEKNVKLMVSFAPANAFEEMAMWTEQGKHWKFPIDNETEIGPEEHVGFHEHVFLEQHLQGFPTAGPIRIFMELVVVGLSKNPYISVERKIENIEWFRQYFKEKESILKQVGAIV